MNGKSKCKLLKDIRRQIAESNDIAYVTSECKFQGECTGTCPKCEAEVRYLEQELQKRRQLGKSVAVAGVAAALMIGMSGCERLDLLNRLNPGTVKGEVPYVATESTENTYELLEGEVPDTTESQQLVLMGDVDLSELTP